METGVLILSATVGVFFLAAICMGAAVMLADRYAKLADPMADRRKRMLDPIDPKGKK